MPTVICVLRFKGRLLFSEDYIDISQVWVEEKKQKPNTKNKKKQIAHLKFVMICLCRYQILKKIYET